MKVETKQHLKNPSSWKRLIFMLLFAFLFNITEIVLVAVVALQFIMHLFTGKSNQQLLNFGKQLSQYIYAIILYLTYNTEELPFPFSPWPMA